jgi:iron complex transport system substrate-binding protein
MKHLSLSGVLLAFATPALAHPVTVQSCDREVTFDTIPARAASNDVNLTEMMLVLGLTDRMVGYTGISGWNKLDETIRAGVAELPELSERYPSREVLIGADLDFWFAGWNYGMRVGCEVTPDTLAPFGIAVYELTESCIHIMARPHRRGRHVHRYPQPRHDLRRAGTGRGAGKRLAGGTSRDRRHDPAGRPLASLCL